MRKNKKETEHSEFDKLYDQFFYSFMNIAKSIGHIKQSIQVLNNATKKLQESDKLLNKKFLNKTVVYPDDLLEN